MTQAENFCDTVPKCTTVSRKNVYCGTMEEFQKYLIKTTTCYAHQSGIKTDIRVNIKPNTKADIRVNTKTNTKADMRVNIKPNTKTDMRANPESNIKTNI